MKEQYLKPDVGACTDMHTRTLTHSLTHSDSSHKEADEEKKMEKEQLN